MNRGAQEITYCSKTEDGDWQRIKAGNEVHLLDFFSAVDVDGNEVAVMEITELTDSDGNSVMDLLEEDTGNITFSTAGIYTATIYTVDAQNVERTQTLSFPVDN